MYVYKNTRTLKKFSHKRYKIIWVGAAGFIDTPLSRSAGACASNLSIFFLDFAIRRVRYGFDRITSGPDLLQVFSIHHTTQMTIPIHIWHFLKTLKTSDQLS